MSLSALSPGLPCFFVVVVVVWFVFSIIHRSERVAKNKEGLGTLVWMKIVYGTLFDVPYSGNFREAEIFAIFAIECQVVKISSSENFCLPS